MWKELKLSWIEGFKLINYKMGILFLAEFFETRKTIDLDNISKIHVFRFQHVSCSKNVSV
jgi:hypothetical protein